LRLEASTDAGKNKKDFKQEKGTLRDKKKGGDLGRKQILGITLKTLGGRKSKNYKKNRPKRRKERKCGEKKIDKGKLSEMGLDKSA